MPRCDTCGNVYDKAFEVRMGPRTYTFDCFECAIHKLAPECFRCGCRVIGHGVEELGAVYCSASCARERGRTELKDRGDLVEVIESPHHP
jgi:hypothetical protein